MLTTTLKLADKYDYLSEKFAKAYHFLRTEDLEALPVGITQIDGNEVFANVQEYTTMPWDECAFEAHDRYFDIQYVVYGREMFGYVKFIPYIAAYLINRRRLQGIRRRKLYTLVLYDNLLKFYAYEK